MEAVVALAGTRKITDTSRRLIGIPVWSHRGTSRVRQAPVVDPDLIRALDVGQVAYIYRGGVTFIQVKRLLAAPAALARSPVTPVTPLARLASEEPASSRPGPAPGPAMPPVRAPADGAEPPVPGPASAAAALLDEAFGPEPR